VDALHGVVAEAVGAERAAVADTVAEDTPGVEGGVDVLPGDAKHVAVVMRLGEAEAEGPPG
jgi:hypothetical protein